MRAWIRAWLLALLFAVPAAALELDAAKQQGLVGEQTDGYVAAVESGAGDEVKQLVADVNSKRRASYEAIAKKNGTAVDAVAALAAQKLVERAPAGSWIRDGGRWYQKQ
jgi:uncharacterized protein YdbL (DUF1318 family)